MPFSSVTLNWRMPFICGRKDRKIIAANKASRLPRQSSSLFSSRAGGQSSMERGFVGNYCVAHEAELVEGALARFAMPGAASVRDDDRHDAEIDRVPHGRLDANFERDAADRLRRDSTVAQGKLQGSALKGRHGQFVEDEFVVSR